MTSGRAVVRTGLLALALCAGAVAFLTVIGLVTWSLREPLRGDVVGAGLTVIGIAAAIAVAGVLLARRAGRPPVTRR